MTTIELFREATTIPCGGATLTFDPDGSVTVSSGDGFRTVQLPGLARSAVVEVWCGAGVAFFVGEMDSSVWYVRAAERRITKATDVDRLDLAGGYDPGGLHRVEFRELEGGDVLLVYELGLACLSADGTCRWHPSHDELAARVERLSDGAVWLQGEHGAFGFHVGTGRPLPDRA